MKTSESFARDLLRLFVWYPLRWAIVSLPPLAGLAMLRAMGDLHFSLSKGKRRMLSGKLSRLGLKPDDNAVREYFRNHYIDRLFIFIFPKLTGGSVSKFVEFSGLDLLDNALAKGRGVVLVHPHFGPVHLPLVALALGGYRLKQIGLPTDEGLSWVGKNVAFRLRLEYEAKIPAEIISADGFMRPVFDWLKSNGVVMVTGDGTGTDTKLGKHADLKLLGIEAHFPLGPALLSQKTGAQYLAMFIVPGDRTPYRAIIEEIGVEKGMDAVERTRAFVGKYAQYIKKSPGYMHFLDRI